MSLSSLNKTLNFKGIRLDFEVYEALKETIKRDVLVLRSFKIMDYRLTLYF